MRVIARLTLDRVVANVFAETEQAASLRVAHRPLIPRRGPASRALHCRGLSHRALPDTASVNWVIVQAVSESRETGTRMLSGWSPWRTPQSTACERLVTWIFW